MTGFKNLRDVCNDFEADLRQASADLFSAKIGESFEDGISKKINDLSLFTSKLRLLRAKPIAATPQIVEQEKSNDTTIANYEELAATKVLEQQIVKFLTQSHAVQELITTQDKNLHPELVERKEKITEALSEYRNKESKLRQLDAVLKEKQEQLAAVRRQWDQELGDLRDLRDRGGDDEDMDMTGPLDKKLRTIVSKLEVMRWLVGKLVAGRSGGYDWLADPQRRLTALRLARRVNTVEAFTE
ncbi:uncharacterized protein LOC128682021 [Plodia interpunctella]|uniref:uncharacterized protein LOC128682021 n=1 Tax=Plodia interpunctella TaxID=58824 RepID=UPI0023682EC4|nr:uncharacterized protein LOC128682021 [Plodia interpunctella]